jgi:hypothetical protein
VFLLCVGSKNLIKSPVAGSVEKSMKLLLRQQHAFYVCAVLFFIVRPSLIFFPPAASSGGARAPEKRREMKNMKLAVWALSLPLSYCCIVSACSLSLIDFSSIDLCVSPTSPNIHHPPRPPAAPISLSEQKQMLQNSVQNVYVAVFFSLSRFIKE